jgi:hypothetical protein
MNKATKTKIATIIQSACQYWYDACDDLPVPVTQEGWVLDIIAAIEEDHAIIPVAPGDPRPGEDGWDVSDEVARMDAQIREAIAILADGTEYERRHVTAILENALDHHPITGSKP